MTIRHGLACGISLFALWGCAGGKVSSHDFQPTDAKQAGQPAANPQAGKQPPQNSAAHPVDQMDAQRASADLLAAKTQSYLNTLTPMVQGRAAATQPPEQPSIVQWIDPKDAWPKADDLRLGGPTWSKSTGSSSGADKAKIVQVVDASPVNANQSSQPIPLATPPSARSNTAVVLNAIENVSVEKNASQAAVDPLAGRLESHLKDYPRDVWGQTQMQMFRLLNDQPAPDMTTLASLPTEDRELVGTVIDGLTNFRNGLRQDSNMLLSSKIRPLIEMSDRLRSQAELTIPTIALCTKVNGYGSYDAIDPARFAADKDHAVLVYCEVGNFLSNLNDKQLWETHLQWDMTLYTEQAIPVWSDKSEQINDQSHVRRRDFFTCKRITIPHTLPIGRYLLKVTILDTQSNHVSEATVPLVIAAQ